MKVAVVILLALVDMVWGTYAPLHNPEPGCVCKPVAPFCASTGETFWSECEMMCGYPDGIIGRYKVHDGPCLPQGKSAKQNYKPLCGCKPEAPFCASTGQTFWSKCEMMCGYPDGIIGRYKVHDGPCFPQGNSAKHNIKPLCGCKPEAPFCASTGQTFWSKCEMMCGYPEGIIGRYKVHDGPCLPQGKSVKQNIKPLCGCKPEAPFCASTGQTFWSKCEMMCGYPDGIIGRYKVHDGPCLPQGKSAKQNIEPPCGCKPEAPFCASTGETFWSQCEMMCGYPDGIIGRYKVHDGPCLPQGKSAKQNIEPLCGCKPEAPFCASTGETFWSECEMMCGYPDGIIGRYKVHDGPCLPQGKSAKQNIEPLCGCKPEAPFCASTGETFWSECEMMCGYPDGIIGRYKVHDGPCLPQGKSAKQNIEPLCGCKPEAPFCASTGETFWSECEMMCGYPEGIIGRYKVHDGPCVPQGKSAKQNIEPPCGCKPEAPLCASTGQTFWSECEMMCGYPDGIIGRYKVHDGPCLPQGKSAKQNIEPPCGCKPEAPFCASTGETFWSQCEMMCGYPDGIIGRYKVHDGPCLPQGKSAKQNIEPLCGCKPEAPFCASTGETFWSECEMMCGYPGGIIGRYKVHDGPCLPQGKSAKQNIEPLCGCKPEAPFCASTGETFWSECEMMCGYPEGIIGRYKVHDGPCLPQGKSAKQNIEPPCGCKPEAPFCASTGETFWSECEMMCGYPEGIIGRYKVHDGPCLPQGKSAKQNIEPPCGCKPEAPFCASTGETFWSECEMMCGYPDGIDGRYKVHDGPC